MESALEYFVRKHETLKHDYREPCTFIALKMGKRLIALGKFPDIRRVSHPNHKLLVPLQYKGKVKWGGHLVCCCDSMIYDPILPNPVSIENYCRRVFGEELEMKIELSTEYIDSVILEKRID